MKSLPGGSDPRLSETLPGRLACWFPVPHGGGPHQHLNLFRLYSLARGQRARLGWSPSTLGGTSRFKLRQRHAEGQQAGALSHRAALPRLLSFRLSMDEHFCQAEALLGRPTPMERQPLVDENLTYAASCSSKEAKQLAKFRKFAIGILTELKQRWQGVTLHLMQFQPSQEPAAG
eukprot:s172_g43.t1